MHMCIYIFSYTYTYIYIYVYIYIYMYMCINIDIYRNHFGSFRAPRVWQGPARRLGLSKLQCGRRDDSSEQAPADPEAQVLSSVLYYSMPNMHSL